MAIRKPGENLSDAEVKALNKEIESFSNLAQEMVSKLGVAGDLTKTFMANMKEVRNLTDETGTALNGLTRQEKKSLKFREESVDLTKEVLQNVKNIGTEEFRSFDVSRKLARARREDNGDLVEQLEITKGISDEQDRQHKLINEQANILGKPFQALDSMIKQIPIIGDLLSASLGLDDMAKDMMNTFKANAAQKLMGKQEVNVTPKVGDVAIPPAIVKVTPKPEEAVLKPQDLTVTLKPEEAELKSLNQPVTLKPEEAELKSLNQPVTISDTSFKAVPDSIPKDAVSVEDQSMKVTPMGFDIDLPPEEVEVFPNVGDIAVDAAISKESDTAIKAGIFSTIMNGIIEGFTSGVVESGKGLKNAFGSILPESMVSDKWKEEMTTAKASKDDVAKALSDTDPMEIKQKAQISDVVPDEWTADEIAIEEAAMSMDTSIINEGNGLLHKRRNINKENKEIAAAILLKEKEIGLAVGDVAAKSGDAGKAAESMLTKTGLITIATVAVAAAAFMVYKQFAKIADELGTAAFAPGWAESFLNPEAAVAFAKEFGIVGKMSARTALNALLIEKKFNISADNVAKLAKAMSNVSSASNETLTAQIYTNSMLARAEGLAPKLVMEDVAANTELFAKFAKDGGNNIFEAARQAAKLGISLSDVAGTAESLLDFESSIEKQMQAEILLGRGLNLDYARRLAFAGDFEDLQKELVRLVGSEAEWNELNYVQRTAMADALGLNVEKVASMVGAQERLNQASGVMERTASDIGAAFIAMAPVILGIVGGLIAALPAIRTAMTGGLSIAADAASVAKGIGVLGTGIGLGTVAGIGLQNATSVEQSPGFQDLEEGKKVDIQRGEARAHAGETITHTDELSKLNEDAEAWRGFKLQQPPPIDTSNTEALSGEMVTLLKGILAVNEKLVKDGKILKERNDYWQSKNIRTIEGLKLA